MGEKTEWADRAVAKSRVDMFTTLGPMMGVLLGVAVSAGIAYATLGGDIKTNAAAIASLQKLIEAQVEVNRTQGENISRIVGHLEARAGKGGG